MERKEILKKAFERSMSYGEYRELIDNLLREEKTTGDNHSDAMLHYTRLNVARMNKWDKYYTPSEEAESLMRGIEDEIWVIITEAWCGDAAHNLPIIQALSELNTELELKLVLRDENPEFMDLHLTNGSKSIPKLIRYRKSEHEEISKWGPRPKAAQDLVFDSKAKGIDYDEYTKNLQIWYARDKGKTLEGEILELIGKESLTVN